MDWLDEIRERWAAIPPGPWRWGGNATCNELDLRTRGRGGQFLMQFVRWGFGRAQPRFPVWDEPGPWTENKWGIMRPVWDRERDPSLKARMLKVGMIEKEVVYRGDIVGIDNPVARALAASPTDVERLIAEVERLRAVEQAARQLDEAGDVYQRVAAEERLRALVTPVDTVA